MQPAVIRVRPAAYALMISEAPASVDGRETGGILLGHDRGPVGLPEVTVAGDPGPGADRRADGFLRDLDHARRLSDVAYDRDGSVWIGEWHTHPSGLPCPSTIDMETYSELLDDPALDFERVVSLIVTPGDAGSWAVPRVWSWLVTPGVAHQAVMNIVPDGDNRADGKEAT